MHYAPEEIIIFLGPSLSHSEAEAILPARYFPPAKQGDILSVTIQYQPKVIGLIDGYFMQALSVWHREILYALNEGIAVLGSSSMGALRAAETAPFGMMGIGKIFELYQNGTVTEDDEVALIHGPAEEDYVPFSIPLINLRFTLQKLCDKIPETIATELFSIAKSLYYPKRTLEMIGDSAKNQGMAADLVDQTIALIKKNYVDQKKEDAKTLLETIKTVKLPFAFGKAQYIQTNHTDALYNSERSVFFDSTSLSQREIVHYAALHHPEFHDLQLHALNQFLATTLAQILKIEANEEEIANEKDRFFVRHKIFGAEKRKEWLLKNHLPPKDCHRLFAKKALVRKFQKSLFAVPVSGRRVGYILEEMKWSNQYEKWLEKAASQKEAASMSSMKPSEVEAFEEAELIQDHLENTNWNLDLDIEKWLKEAGFINMEELKKELICAYLFSRKAL